MHVHRAFTWVQVAGKITTQNAPHLLGGKVGLSLSQRPSTPSVSNMTKQQFLGAVEKTKEYIQVGGRVVGVG